MFLDLFSLTLSTYILMVVFSSAIGYQLGSVIEKQPMDNIGKNEKMVLAKDQAAFVVINCRYLFLLFPSLVMAVSYNGHIDIVWVWLFCFSSTALLQSLIQEAIGYLFFRSKDK